MFAAPLFIPPGGAVRHASMMSRWRPPRLACVEAAARRKVRWPPKRHLSVAVATAVTCAAALRRSATAAASSSGGPGPADPVVAWPRRCAATAQTARRPIAAVVVAAAAGCGAKSAVAAARGAEWRQFFLRTRPLLLVCALVLQKCLTDALTWYTRARGGTYSGTSVALICEAVKYPLLAAAIAFFESPRVVLPTFAEAFSPAPWLIVWVGLAYAVQNLLYFVCLDYISPAAYQVLSQSKMIFTAGLMAILLRKRFSRQQLLALLLLVVGSAATQLAEFSGGVLLAVSGHALLGCALTVLSALISALPNVFYERLLKSEGKNEWVANLQLTTSILFWVCAFKLSSFAASGAPDGLGSTAAVGGGLLHPWGQLTRGFTPTVWLIIVLKALSCIIIPACLKYADNIIYGYAKPVSIVVTCGITAVLTSSLPPLAMLAGVAMVVTSMALYSKG